MSKPINDGGPAFPVPNGAWNMCGGMSLRDWFAGHALVSILHDGCVPFGCTVDYRTPDWQAVAAYQIADAMIRARSQAEAEEEPS